MVFIDSPGQSTDDHRLIDMARCRARHALLLAWLSWFGQTLKSDVKFNDTACSISSAWSVESHFRIKTRTAMMIHCAFNDERGARFPSAWNSRVCSRSEQGMLMLMFWSPFQRPRLRRFARQSQLIHPLSSLQGVACQHVNSIGLHFSLLQTL